MKKLALLAVLLCSSTASARPLAPLSAGIVLSTPEIFGGFLSYWPISDMSVDVRATLSTVEGGISAHLPLAGAGKPLESNVSRHDIVLTGMGGYVHHSVTAGAWSNDTIAAGPRFIAAAGYGHQGAWDVRIMGGISGYEATGWHWDPTFWLNLGMFF